MATNTNNNKNSYEQSKEVGSIEVFSSNVYSVRLAKAGQIVHTCNSKLLSGLASGRFNLSRKSEADKILEEAISHVEEAVAKVSKLTRNHSKAYTAPKNKPGSNQKSKAKAKAKTIADKNENKAAATS